MKTLLLPMLSAGFTLLITSLSEAAEGVTFTTREGHHFANVTVTRVVGRKLEVTTPAGPRIVRFESLPRELQERFFPPSMLFPPKVGDLLDFKTTDGRAIRGELREVSPKGLTLTRPDGLELIPYRMLPPELASSFPYDTEDTARYEAAERQHRQRLSAARQAAEKKEAAERAARERAQRERSQAAKPADNAAPMGRRGEELLGTPQLGGRGLPR